MKKRLAKTTLSGKRSWHKLQDRLEAAGEQFEWAEILRDVKALENVEVKHDEKRFLLRTELEGSCGPVFRSVGVAIPPTIQKL